MQITILNEIFNTKYSASTYFSNCIVQTS